jgi:hypothetical protein
MRCVAQHGRAQPRRSPARARTNLLTRPRAQAGWDADSVAQWQEEQRRYIEADVLAELSSNDVVGYIHKVRARARSRFGRATHCGTGLGCC